MGYSHSFKGESKEIFDKVVESNVLVNEEFATKIRGQLDENMEDNLARLVDTIFHPTKVMTYASMILDSRENLDFYTSEAITYLYLVKQVKNTEAFKKKYLDGADSDIAMEVFSYGMNNVLKCIFYKVLDIYSAVVYNLNETQDEDYALFSFFLEQTLGITDRYFVLHNEKTRSGEVMVYKYYNSEEDCDMHPLIVSYKI